MPHRTHEENAKLCAWLALCAVGRVKPLQKPRKPLRSARKILRYPSAMLPARRKLFFIFPL